MRTVDWHVFHVFLHVLCFMKYVQTVLKHINHSSGLRGVEGRNVAVQERGGISSNCKILEPINL